MKRMLMVCALWVAGKRKIKLMDRWSQRKEAKSAEPIKTEESQR